MGKSGWASVIPIRQRSQLFGLELLIQRYDDLLQSTGQDLVQFVEGEIDAVVGDPVLGVVVSTDAFGAVAAADLATLNHLTSELLPSEPARILLLQDLGIQNLIATTRAERADMLVLGASEELLKPESLRPLLEQLRCPICLVRQWDGRI